MKIGTFISYSGGFKDSVAEVAELEQAGLDTVWVAEAYGMDAVRFYTKLKTVTSRWPTGMAHGAEYTMPVMR